MDTTHFDRITMALAGQPGRRDLLRLLGLGALTAGSLSLLGSDDAEAGKRRKKRNKNKNRKKKCKGKCGGKCPRCGVGKSCNNRDQCVTAFCDGGACTEPDDAGQCGLDTNGENCFRRDSVDGLSYCSRQVCRFIAGGSCKQCKGDELCSPAGGEDIECCAPCGAPL